MKSKNVTLMALIIALGGFLFGYDLAMISGTTSQIGKAFNLSQSQLGFTIALSLIGTILGTLLVGKPADKYGRKNTLVFLAAVFGISAVASASANQWHFLLLARFITGLAMGAVSVVAPMFIAEIAPAKKRGQLVLFNQLNVVTAIFLAYVINYLIAHNIEGEYYRTMILVEAIPAFLFFALLFIVPNSPRWLIMKGNMEGALVIFKQLKFANPKGEMASIKDALEHGIENVRAKLFTPEHRKPIIITILIAAFNQLAGINAIIIYAPRVFAMTGIGDDAALMQSISIGLTNLIFTIIALFLIDRFGRRHLLMAGSIGMVVFLSLIAYSFETGSYGGGYAVVAYMVGFIACFAFSQGAVLWVVIAEVFPSKVRSQGQALGSFTHWVMAAALGWVFPVIVNPLKPAGWPFAFFAVMMAIHFVFAWKVLPETKGKSLEQIQEDFKKSKRA